MKDFLVSCTVGLVNGNILHGKIYFIYLLDLT